MGGIHGGEAVISNPVADRALLVVEWEVDASVDLAGHGLYL